MSDKKPERMQDYNRRVMDALCTLAGKPTARRILRRMSGDRRLANVFFEKYATEQSAMTCAMALKKADEDAEVVFSEEESPAKA